MTNWTIARDMTDEERAKGLHCFVQHADAGGRCEEPASTYVYGLAFCERHGAEAAQGMCKRYNVDAHDDRDYRAALLIVYPEIPESVRLEIDNWKRVEAPDVMVEDLLLDALDTLHKCIWTAYEDDAMWLVEQLEIMRQAEAARCAYAMRELSPQR